MNIDDKNMVNFMKDYSYSFRTNGHQEKDIFSLENIHLNNKECIYLLDFVKNKIIYAKGFQNVLGYADKNISFEFIIDNHHPEDNEAVNRISKAAILHCMENPANVLNSVLFIAYRRKKKDGTYIKVLSESSIFEINDKGMPTKGFTKITDISFIDTSEVVNYWMEADDFNKEAFNEKIYSAYADFFTDREKDIIKELAKDLTTRSIAEKLCISEHTIATHRKHILKKSNTHKTEDLLLFCKRKGII